MSVVEVPIAQQCSFKQMSVYIVGYVVFVLCADRVKYFF